MADVFISYHTDSGLETVREIAAALESAGVSCWYANRDIKGGDFAEQITTAIYECKVFLLLLNAQSNASWDVQNEVKLAYDRNKEEGKPHILPYRIADCRPTGGMLYRITRFVIVEKKDEDTPALISRVARLLGREPVRPKPVQPEPAPAQVQLPHGLRPMTLEEFVSATAPKKEKKPETTPAPSIVLPAQPRITFPIRKIYRPAIAAGLYFTVGIRTDGTVIGAGDSNWYSTKRWRGVVSLAAGEFHTVGLKADGTVLATVWNEYGQCDVSGWPGVAAVAAGAGHTVGLKADGAVLATGFYGDGQCDVSGWSGVAAVAAGRFHTVGLKADGAVLATGSNDYGQCDVSGWSDVVAVAAGSGHTVGLKADGTVLATGLNNCGQCDVSGWSDVVAVAAGSHHTVGLKADGTVLATGLNNWNQCNVQDWRLRLPEWVGI